MVSFIMHILELSGCPGCGKTTVCSVVSQDFVNEGIISIIEQGEHRVDFYTPEDDFLLSTPLPIVEDGGKAYFDICCGVENGIITMKFPVYNWVDNYPHCDGEYDRWDTTVIGYHVMKFNLSDNSVTIDLFN